MSEPWATALQTSAISALGPEALELGRDRVEGEGHVGAGVAVGHGVDVQPVDDFLVGPQARPDRPA